MIVADTIPSGDSHRTLDFFLERHPVSALTHSIMNDEQLEQVNAGRVVPVVFERLTARPVHLALRGARSETMSVWSTTSNSGFISRRNLPADMVTIRFVDSGTIERADVRGDATLTVFNQVSFTSYDEMSSQQASPGFTAMTAAVSRIALVNAWVALVGSERATLPRFDRAVDVKSAPMRSLRQSLTVLRDHMSLSPDNHDLMTPLLQDLLTYQIVSAWLVADDRVTAPSFCSADQVVRQAIDYMEAHLRNRLCIAEIANASHTTVRRLQDAFRSRMGCSPIQFLIGRRLDKVRAELKQETPLTVQQIATGMGFTHMSDFTRRYQERFGNTPAASRRGWLAAANGVDQVRSTP